MTRHGRRWGLASSTLAAAGLLAACSGGGDPGPAADAAATAASSSPFAPSGPSSPAEAPSPGDLSTPATSAGPLSRSSFPKPGALGAGWKYSVDPGNAEEGYLGNGTPALARDPLEAAQAAVPLGCPRRGSLPTPEHALEVDYTYRGTKVVTVRMAFADAASAGTFFHVREANLTACRGRSGGSAIGALVSRVTPLTATALLSDRTPGSDPWSELAVLDRDSVVLVAARTPPDRPPLAGRQARALARSFRR